MKNRSSQTRNRMACGMVALCLAMGGHASSVSAQEAAGLATGSPPSRSIRTTRIQSLDDLRDLNAQEKSMTRVGVELPVDASYTTPKRQEALNLVRQLRAALAEEGDRAQMEKTLRQALDDFFLADMQYRVEELDKIKRKVRETEATLQKRLEAKDESIDLQVQLLFQEADGISVFGTAEPAPNRPNPTYIGVPYDPTLPSGQQPLPTSR